MAQDNRDDVIQDLRKSLAWLDLVLATLNEGVLTLDKELKVHFANDAIAETLNVNRIFLLGLPLWKALPISLEGKLLKKQDYSTALAHNNIQSLSRVYSLKASDKELAVDVTFGYIPKIEQIVVVVRDITKLNQESAYIRLLQEITTAANESQTIEQAMAISLKLICEHSKWPIGHVYYVVKTKGLVPTDIWYLKNPRKFTSFRKFTESINFKPGKGLPGRVLSSGKPAWVSNLNSDKNFPRIKQAKAVGIQSGTAFPVLIRDEVVAVLEFFSTELIFPNASLLQLMANIGTQLGRVVERSRNADERIKFTREQAARAEAEESEKRYRRLVESTNVIPWEADADTGIFTYVGPQAEKIFGYPIANWYAETFWPDHIHPEDREWAVNFCIAAIKTQKEYEFEYRMLTKEGQVIWLHDVVSVTTKDDGKKILAGFLVDITDRKKAQKALEDSKERFRFLAKASKILSFSLDYKTTLSNIAELVVPEQADWCIIYIKDEKGAIQRLTIASSDKAEIKNTAKIQKEFRINPKAKTGVPYVIRTGKPLLYKKATPEVLSSDVYESKKLTKIVKTFNIKSSMCVPLSIRDNVFGAISFISKKEDFYYSEEDLRFAEEIASRASTAIENARLYAESQKAVALRDDFISVASHELKTPVTSLKMYAQVLQKQFERRGEKETFNKFSKIDSQINKLTLLIQDLLNISKLQSGKLEFRYKEFDLNNLVNEVVESIQPTVRDHKIKVKGKVKKKVIGDPDRTGQVIANLLTNAVKYSPAADKVILQLLQQKDCAVVKVKDFGIGIDKKHQKKIFERFYRVSGTEEKTFPGLGLGLYISNEIVKRHGGSMKVSSIKNKGSTFTFTLPFKQNIKK